MALVSCWSCGLDFDNPGTVDIFCPNPTENTGEWINVTPPEDMDGPDCPDCRKRLREQHCPQLFGGKKRIGQAPIGGDMRSFKGRLDRSQIKRNPPSTAEEGRRKTNLAIGGAVIMAASLGTIGYLLGEGTKVGKAGGAMLGVGLPLVGYSLYRASTCVPRGWGGCLDVGIFGGLGGVVSGAAIGGAMSSNKVIGGVAGGFVGFFSPLIIAKPLIDARRQKQMVRDQY